MDKTAAVYHPQRIDDRVEYLKHAVGRKSLLMLQVFFESFAFKVFHYDISSIVGLEILPHINYSFFIRKTC